jgi:hypothetical protein
VAALNVALVAGVAACGDDSDAADQRAAEQRDLDVAHVYIDRKTTAGKTPGKPAGPTNATSPTGSSAECGPTNAADQPPSRSPLDKGASDSPPPASSMCWTPGGG